MGIAPMKTSRRCNDPRHRAGDGLGHRGERQPTRRCSVRARVRAFFGLVPRSLERRQGAARTHLEEGDRYIARCWWWRTAVLRYAKKGGSPSKTWAGGALAGKPFKVAAVALANKTARIAWRCWCAGNLPGGPGRCGRGDRSRLTGGRARRGERGLRF